ncbi:MAG: HAD-IIA family hydrolase [candidate division Zixibacteria bacterium]|nr:HAD-IIA family hydrolase [candidate division Zixibacteria bacterium]
MNKFKLKELVDCKKCIVMDLDGTVFLGEQPIQPSVDFINKYKDTKQFFFITNNTSHTPDEYVEKLHGFGLNIKVNQIISPLLQAVSIIKENKFESVFLLANTKITKFFKKSLSTTNFTTDFKNADALVVTYDNELTYEKMKNAAFVLQNYPVRYIVTHRDKVCPTEKGMIPDVGSFVEMLFTATNRYPELILGKPDTGMIVPFLADYSKEEILVIGDRLYTDKKLADNMEVDFLLVLTGETKKTEIKNLSDEIYSIKNL